MKELHEWKGIEFTYIAKAANAVFQIERSTLIAHGSNVWLEARDGNALMHLADGEQYSLTEPGDLPLTFQQGFPPLTEKALKVKFRNGDVCFFCVEREGIRLERASLGQTRAEWLRRLPRVS